MWVRVACQQASFAEPILSRYQVKGRLELSTVKYSDAKSAISLFEEFANQISAHVGLYSDLDPVVGDGGPAQMLWYLRAGLRFE